MPHPDLVFVGFGEAAQAFASDIAATMRAFDRKTEVAEAAAAKRADYLAAGVTGAESNGAAVGGAPLILSLVTADQALAAAEESARSIDAGALYCDMNSVAPATKRAAALAVEAAGGRYVDVAVMAPVHPQRTGVPLLVSGPHAEAGAAALKAIGFSPRVVGAGVGDASAIKMIRSVMVKGLEALSAECVLAAVAAGVADEVIASLDGSWREQPWAARLDYNLDRMLVHGLRRAAEMEEAVRTLEGLGTGAAMTRGTVARQRALGAIGRGAPDGLLAKAALIRQALAGGRDEEQAERTADARATVPA